MSDVICMPHTITVYTLNQAFRIRDCNITALADELNITRNTLRKHLDCGGEQLVQSNGHSLTYINRGWTK